MQAPRESPSDGDEVWAAMCSIYEAYLRGDREAIDARIASGATLWDAVHEPLIRGKAELDAVRDARPDDGPEPTDLVPEDPVIDVIGDVAVVRHVLRVATAGAADRRVRNTSVWRRDGARWLCIHNHEDLLPSVW